MRIYTAPRRPKTVPFGALLMVPLFALPLGAWIVEQGYIDLGVCGMRQALDMPCMTCGATRATMALFGGDLWSALSLQPMIISLYFILVAWGTVSFAAFMTNRRILVDMTRAEDIIFKVSLVVLPLANWAYLIWFDI